MLGDKISETTGKRLVRRTISADPLKVEVSFEDTGTLFGAACQGFGTYTSQLQANGTLYGEGQGATMTADGDVVTWRGAGTGHIKPDGSLSYRGMLFYQSPSPKLARLNGIGGAFEYDVAPDGTSRSQAWEWK